MDLKTYAVTRGGVAKLGCHVLESVAARAGCSPATLYMIATGHKQPGPKLATRIERATDAAVSRHDLRPDIFGTPEAR